MVEFPRGIVNYYFKVSTLLNLRYCEKYYCKPSLGNGELESRESTSFVWYFNGIAVRNELKMPAEDLVNIYVCAFLKRSFIGK